jgi:hypothetical protein
MTAIIVDHHIAFRRPSLDFVHSVMPPVPRADEYTPWIITRQWRPS